MEEKIKNDLFYVCSLIEYIARKTKNQRSLVTQKMGKGEIQRQIELAEVNHCLSFDEVADELIEHFDIPMGNFDSVALCEYEVPNFQAIGKVYQRLILSVSHKSLAEGVYDVFTSFISEYISDFNSSVYYSNPDYIKASYEEGLMLA